jgi:hypothetical protein
MSNNYYYRLGDDWMFIVTPSPDKVSIVMRHLDLFQDVECVLTKSATSTGVYYEMVTRLVDLPFFPGHNAVGKVADLIWTNHFFVPTCACGGYKLKMPHSDWCPCYKQPGSVK